MRIAVIGGGISGLSAAQMLNAHHEVTVYEKEKYLGGLLHCRRVDGSLFHTCGGHVFNTKRQDVLDWFWRFFDRDREFIKADRNSVVVMGDGTIVPYPIENHVYMMSPRLQQSFIKDLLDASRINPACKEPDNFEDFLLERFGKTLYDLYFYPYNKKVWRRSLRNVPLAWLEGKLPMPTVEEMIYNNFNHIEEKQFVHASFWYSLQGGSQFLIDRLSEGLDIITDAPVAAARYSNGSWHLRDREYDRVLFCGNIKDLVAMVQGIDVSQYVQQINDLSYHGTTAVFCEIDKNPYSWIYLPSGAYESHRIICTGNFSASNNGSSIPGGRMTATVEFTDEIGLEGILANLKTLPFHPRYIDHCYQKYTYPIQSASTKAMVNRLKKDLSSFGFFFTGRFADWEYYNMDASIGAAMDTCKWMIKTCE